MWIAVILITCGAFSSILFVCGKQYSLAYMTGQRISHFKFSRNGAAPEMAVRRAQIDGILNNIEIEIIYKDDQFNPTLSMGYTMEMYESVGVDGFIGVGSSTVLAQTGYLMAYWNLPVFSQASTDPKLQDKSVYKTLIRLVPPFNKVGAVVREIVTYFGWRRLLIVSRSSGLCEYSSRAVFTELTQLGLLIPIWIKFENGLDAKETELILENIRTKARIVYFCGNDDEKEKFMMSAYHANLTTPEYVYLLPPYRPLDEEFEPWADNSNPNRDALLESSRAFIQISLFDLNGDEVDRFLEDHVQKMIEIWNYNLTAEDKTTSKYALFLHDATYLYALTLNKTLEAGDDPRNGTLFTYRARHLTFEGVSGHVAFDENGDREPTCSLFYLREGENKSRLWAKTILSNPPGQRMEVLEAIVWRTESGVAPPDTPGCGFLGELCLPEDDENLPLILSLVLVAIIVVIGGTLVAFYIRKRAVDKRLREMLWKVSFKDISFVDGNKFQRSLGSLRLGLGSSSSGLVSRRSLSYRESTSLLSTMESIDGGQIFTKVALYRGQVVSVKFVKSFDLQPGSRDELTQMRELTHENLNSFIGACIEPGKSCTLTEYCQKGSLQDVLENDHIQLDSIFKESLIFDLVNGMLYLHSSPLRSHGNLKSSNCVIDSRWVLKITDFHPTCVVLMDQDGAGEYETYRAKLWTAPDLLRAPFSPRRGSPKADVFSFSIVLQEILYRALPYFMEDMSPKEIVKRVEARSAVPFRPNCPSGIDVKPEYIRLMKMCWDESPQDRPSFSEIKKILERSSERGKVNIMDRIVQKLETYSNNLEDIVRERTVALREEKLKTDSLLYQMLPTVVADRLKQGRNVTPELYDDTTVYFSDVLGFVEMAAHSSPMEVVCLLNDLYEMLDSLVANYDVYKVETIGDSYMVVSGIPVRNGRRHVAEIADMSLHILQAAQALKIRHRPGEIIQLRIGFHTGSCCAGVVGLAMPRYCLFGDTVNTASRMESNGDALKIHISQESYTALSTLGNYKMTKRGDLFVKGKGMLTTYWLEGQSVTTFSQ